MQFNNLLSNNFDRVLNDFLKERVKYYIKEKEKISPNIVLKENFIFNLVDDCIRIYCSSLIEQKYCQVSKNYCRIQKHYLMC